MRSSLKALAKSQTPVQSQYTILIQLRSLLQSRLMPFIHYQQKTFRSQIKSILLPKCL
jgi:hypothetical protein